MSRTQKDSRKARARQRFLRVVKHDDGTFDISRNQRLILKRILERYLPEELCSRFGFCGEEYKAILREVEKNGSATIFF